MEFVGEKMSNLADRIESIRSRFPALARKGKRHASRIYLDAPGGTQVPEPVIGAMTDYLTRYNCNTHGQFATSEETDRMIRRAREAASDFLGAPGPHTIHFGANMSTMTFHLSRAIGYLLEPGDEIIVSHLDHDANISPWLALERFGVHIRWLDFHREACTLRMEDLPAVLSPRTRLIAIGYASNAVGTINDVAQIIRLAHDAGAWAFVDAVHFAPHSAIDVQSLDCDFLLCSAYKFFGPHLGVAYVKSEVAEQIPVDRVRPQEPHPPEKFETGTLNHEGLAGLIAAIDFLADVCPEDPGAPRRQRLVQSMRHIAAHDRELAGSLIDGLKALPGVTIHGVTDADQLDRRTATVSITIENQHPRQIARMLGEEDIFVWDGDFFAVEVIRQLGLADRGGLLRIGPTLYNTTEEIDRFLNTLESILHKCS